MRQAVPVLLISLLFASPAFAQSGGAGSTSGGGAGATSATSGASSPGSGSTVGVSPSGSGANNPSTPATVNDQLRANSGTGLRSPAPGTVLPGATNTTAQQVGSGLPAGGRTCATADCSSPLQGRYMQLVDSMARIAGVPAGRRDRSR